MDDNLVTAVSISGTSHKFRQSVVTHSIGCRVVHLRGRRIQLLGNGRAATSHHIVRVGVCRQLRIVQVQLSHHSSLLLFQGRIHDVRACEAWYRRTIMHQHVLRHEGTGRCRHCLTLRIQQGHRRLVKLVVLILHCRIVNLLHIHLIRLVVIRSLDLSIEWYFVVRILSRSHINF